MHAGQCTCNNQELHLATIVIVGICTAVKVSHKRVMKWVTRRGHKMAPNPTDQQKNASTEQLLANIQQLTVHMHNN